jgi:hypothetical protein
MSKCHRCNKRLPEADSDICFHCRVASVGFSFVGGGGYTRQHWNERTVAEKRVEVLGDRVLGVDAEPASTFGG